MQKTGDGYRLPGVSRAGIPQRLQMKPHETFTPEYVSTRAPYRLWVGDGPAVPHFATPPDWTEQAECVGDWVLFDDPDAATFKHKVKPICEACPVKDLCLAEAMRDEGDDPAACRGGVRGGLLPRDRALLAAPAPPAACGPQGHPMGVEGSFFSSTDNMWRCRECNKLNRQRSRERARAREMEAAA